jgi:hypothetical protein
MILYTSICTYYLSIYFFIYLVFIYLVFIYLVFMLFTEKSNRYKDYSYDNIQDIVLSSYVFNLFYRIS